MFRSLRTLKFLTVFSAAVVALSAIGLMSLRTVLRQAEDATAIARAYDTNRRLDAVKGAVSYGQTELRAFFVTRDPQYLAYYRASVDTLRQLVTLAEGYVSADEDRLAFAALRTMLRLREERNDEKIALTERFGPAEAERLLPLRDAQRSLRSIDSLIHAVQLRVDRQRTEHAEDSRGILRQTLAFVTIGGMVSVAIIIIIIFLFLNREIRQRTQAEQGVRDSERRFLSFLGAVPAGITIVTPDGKPYFANEEAKRLLGRGVDPAAVPEEADEVFDSYVQGTNQPYPPDRHPIARALTGERSTVADIEVWRPDRVVPLFVTGAPIIGADGRMEYAMAAFVDISDQKKVEMSLAESEERYRQFIENATDVIYRTDNRGMFTYVNPVGVALFGYSAEELAGKRYTDMLLPAEQEAVRRFYVRQTLSRTRNTYREVTAVTRSGERIVLGQNVQLLFKDGAVIGFQALARDITAPKRTEELLARQKRQFETVIDTVGEGITLSDERGRFEIYNRKMEELTGYSMEEANDGDFSAKLYPDPADRQRALDRIETVVFDGMTENVETEIRTRSGETKTLLVSTRLLRLKNRTMFLSAYRDITLRKRDEAELRQAKESAESATVAKSLFLATMSHEIRTPMNGVIGMTDLLLQTELTDEQRDFTDIIRTSGETLLTLINDILDFSKIESGKLELEQRPVEVQSLIEESFDLVAHRAVDKRLDLVYLIEPAVPPFVIGDPTRLRQVLLNLTNNAIKFTDRGEVFVTVAEVSRGERRTELRFSVRDTGIGISKEKVHHLFDAFTQVDASTTRKYGGTGLGLAITKRLVELMGGRLWAESELGKGSVFHFTISVPTVEDLDAMPKKYVRGATPELNGKRVLLVDDNPTNLNILSIQCSNWGMRPRATASTAEALRWLDAGDPFDVAVVDYHMPGMDGVRFAEEVRRRRDRAALPMVLFTSSSKSDAPIPNQELFADIILKPMKAMQLYAALTGAMSSEPGRARSAAAPKPAAVEKLADQCPLSILVAEDNLINQKLALRFLQQLGYTADVAENGAVAIRKLERQPYDVIFMDLHMPELDGLEATRRIVAQTDPAVRPVIIAMTADAMTGDRERCLDAGMDDYISKPVRLEALRAMLESYGKRIAAKRNGVSDSMLFSMMFKRLSDLQAETDAEFIREFIAGIPEQLESGWSDLRASVEKNDLKESVFHAHKLRGLLLTLGAVPAAEFCRQIESSKSEEALAGLADRMPLLRRELDRTTAALGELGTRLTA
ncbi:MAG: PAS domain S-box protein [Bacteroidetes bacterium]|nr:MAG: PAS domain S-box protein [Bacteroidota bacterium]